MENQNTAEYIVWRFGSDDPTDQFVVVAKTPSLEEARKVARPGDQIQLGDDGQVWGV